MIEPDNLADLQIVPGKDYVTLMTCTPYMINSHRLLVRGHRIATPPPGEEAAPAAAVQVQPQAEQAVWPWILAAIAAACLLALCIIAKKAAAHRRGFALPVGAWACVLSGFEQLGAQYAPIDRQPALRLRAITTEPLRRCISGGALSANAGL